MIKDKLGLGTVQFGIHYGISNMNGQTPEKEVSNILDFASANHIEVLDTASAYGSAEQILGNNNLTGFKVISKFSNSTDNKGFRKQLNKSLSDLKLNSIYGYLAHRPLEIIENPFLWEELSDLKTKNIISKRGFSLNDPSELIQLLDQNFIPDLIQVPYNYFDQRFESLIKELKSNGCEVHTRSVFLQGLFFKDPSKLSDFFNSVKPMILELQQLKSRLSSALLKFVLIKPFIDNVIIGVENLNQLRENILEIDMSDDLPSMDVSFLPSSILMPSHWPKS